MLLLVTLQGFGQSHGFIIEGDSVYSDGFIRYDHLRPHEIRFSNIRRGTPITYTVNELTGFGFQDSTIYVSKNLRLNDTQQRLFVEVLGDSTFFYLQRDKAFFKNTSTLERLSKVDLLPHLQSLTPPGARWNNELHLFRLKRNSLRYFANNLAAGKAPTVHFTSIGAFTGFNRSTFSVKDAWLNATSFDKLESTSNNIRAGVFADLPFWAVNNLSLQAQGSYGKMRFNKTEFIPGTRYDFKVDFDFAWLSLMPKYSLRYPKFRLLAQAGPSVLYFLKKDSRALETLTESDKVWVNLLDGLPVDSNKRLGLKASIGFEAGAGISFFYLPKHYLSLGISQSNTYGEQFSIRNQSVTISLNL